MPVPFRIFGAARATYGRSRLIDSASTVSEVAPEWDGQVLSVHGKCCHLQGRHQATRILSIAATKKMRPKINAGNVI
jgi:hypothetical protein